MCCLVWLCVLCCVLFDVVKCLSVDGVDVLLFFVCCLWLLVCCVAVRCLLLLSCCWLLV